MAFWKREFSPVYCHQCRSNFFSVLTFTDHGLSGKRCALAALVLYAASFSSNSFVINEDVVTVFLLVTFVTIDQLLTSSEAGKPLLSSLLDRLKSRTSNNALRVKRRTAPSDGALARIALMLLVGLVSRVFVVVFRRCREENYESCETWITHKPTNGLQSDEERRARSLLSLFDYV